MYRLALPLLFLAASASIVRADVLEQSFTYDWNSANLQHPFAFQPFDDLGGTRQLHGVRLGFSGTIQMEITAQTYGNAIAAGDWSAEASHTVVAYFNPGQELELLQGIGGQWTEGITGDLGAGAPGAPYVFTHTLAFSNVVDVDSAIVPEFIGTEPLPGFMDGFFDGVVTPPQSGQWIELYASLLSQQGTVTLTYDYSTIPEPAGLTVLGAGAMLLLRRRR